MVQGLLWLVAFAVIGICFLFLINMLRKQRREMAEGERIGWIFIALALLFQAMRAIFDFLLDNTPASAQEKMLQYYFITGFLALLAPLCFVVAVIQINRAFTTEYTLSSSLINSLKRREQGSEKDFLDTLKSQTNYNGSAVVLYLIDSTFDVSSFFSSLIQKSTSHAPVPFVTSVDHIPEHLYDKSFFVGAAGPNGAEVITPSDLSSLFSAISMLLREIDKPLLFCLFLETLLAFNEKKQVKRFILDIVSAIKSQSKDIIFVVDKMVVDEDIVELLKFSSNYVYEYKEVDHGDTIDKLIRATKLPGSQYTSWMKVEEIFTTK